MSKNSGKIVKTKSGKIGRTYDTKDLVNGKVPVYLQESENTYKTVAMLCDHATLTLIGFID